MVDAQKGKPNVAMRNTHNLAPESQIHPSPKFPKGPEALAFFLGAQATDAGEIGVVTAESDPLGFGGLHSHVTLVRREGMIHGMDGWMSLPSDFSFVFFSTYKKEHSKPASCSGLLQYARWTVEARPDGKRYVLDCDSIGSLSIANKLGSCHLSNLTCDQDPTTQGHYSAQPTGPRMA